MLKKLVRLSGMESLGAETLASTPVALLLFCFSFNGAEGSLPVFTGWQGLNYLTDLPLQTWLLLPLSGFFTVTTLYCFARCTKLLPLSAVGFTQFLSPSLSFILGVWIFGEAFTFKYVISFIFIWAAVILYIASLYVVSRKPGNIAK